MIALIHAFLVITLRANQIVSGLALTIFAGGGRALVLPRQRPRTWPTSPPATRSTTSTCSAGRTLPVVGPILFGQTAARLRSRGCSVVVVGLYLARTRAGLNLRAVGESPAAADAMGINVSAYRYAHTIVGGALAGVGGACFSLVDHAAVGRRPDRRAPAGSRSRSSSSRSGAPSSAWSAPTSSGRSRACGFTLQARGVTSLTPSCSTLPYVMTIVVLVAVSASGVRRRLGAPAALGVPYVREER